MGNLLVPPYPASDLPEPVPGKADSQAGETSKRAVDLHISKARRVLDFGCGTGWLIGELEAEGEPFRVGIDHSFASIQEAKQYRGIAFAVADGLLLPFANEIFDVVIGHVSMPYMNTAKALCEIYRVMTPGGTLFLTFHNVRYARQRLWASAKRLNWKDVLFSMYMTVNGLLNHFSLAQMEAWWTRSRFETVNTPRGIHRTASAAGFSLISTEHSVARIFFAATASKPNADTGAVLPQTAWSVYCRLSRETERARAANPE